MEGNRKPDWGTWRQLSDVKDWEAIALSLNIDHRQVRHPQQGWMTGMRYFDEADEFDARYHLLTRILLQPNCPLRVTSHAGALDTNIPLAQFVSWAMSIPWEIPSELRKLAEEPCHEEQAAAGISNARDWVSRQLWTSVEAACLLSGRDPVPPEDFNKYRKTHRPVATIYDDLKDGIDLKQIKFIKSRDGFIRGRRVQPDQCVTWALSHGHDVPDALLPLRRADPSETPEQRKVRLKRDLWGRRRRWGLLPRLLGVNRWRCRWLFLPGRDRACAHQQQR